MTAIPPSAGARALPTHVALRQARESECAVLTDVAHAAKRVWGYPEPWIAQWRPLLTITPDFLSRAVTVVAEQDGVVVGFMALVLEGRRARLEHLWIRPEAMRRGIGRRLFTAAVEYARARRALFLLIEADPNAASFYERMGATRIGDVFSTVEGTRRAIPLMRLEL